MAAQAPAQWWAVQEGALGDIVNRLSTFPGGSTGDVVTWHVVQSAKKPNATAHGPYATQAQAQAEADTLSGQDQNVVAQGVESAVSSASPLGPLFQKSLWLRVGEFAVGLVLLGIGLNAMFKGRPLAVVTGAAGAVGKVAP